MVMDQQMFFCKFWAACARKEIASVSPQPIWISPLMFSLEEASSAFVFSIRSTNSSNNEKRTGTESPEFVENSGRKVAIK